MSLQKNPPLLNKVAVVTGAAGTMGAAAARFLLEDGCRLALLDINKSALDAVVQTLSGEVLALACDISDPDAVRDACTQIRQSFGEPDILVNNAGILTNNKILATEASEWRKVLGVNLDAAFYLAQQVIPGMKARGWGRIINISSVAAKTGGLTAGTTYSVSKGALISFTFSLARELARDGITVNGIAPAYVKTPMIMEQLSEEQRQKLLKDIPVGRFCEPEEFAHVVRFLSSPLSGFITGEIIDINGGLIMD